MVPIVPVAFAFATELTHPLAPALVIGLMVCESQIALFFVNFGYLAILKNQTEKSSQIVLCLLAFIAALSVLASLFIKEDLRRLDSVASLSMIMSNSESKSQKSNSSPRSTSFKEVTKPPIIKSEASRSLSMGKDSKKPMLSNTTD